MSTCEKVLDGRLRPLLCGKESGLLSVKALDQIKAVLWKPSRLCVEIVHRDHDMSEVHRDEGKRAGMVTDERAIIDTPPVAQPPFQRGERDRDTRIRAVQSSCCSIHHCHEALSL